MLSKKIDYSKLPEADVVIREIKKRKSKGLMTLILTTGLPGTGKSSVDIRLAELTAEVLNKPKITERNIVDSLLGLLEFVKNAKEVGEIVIVEEVSVLFPSVRAMAQENVILGKVLDTLRKKEMVMFANAPLLKRIDKHILSLSNVLVETLRINKTIKIVVSKALRLQTNSRSGKTYFHRFSRKGREVHRIYTRKPNKELWKAYESRKDAFIEELYDRLKAENHKKQLKLDKDILKSKGLSSVRKMTARELQIHNLVNIKGLKQQEAAEELGIEQSTISKTLRNILKKQGIAREMPNIYQ